jgi:uncharacterized protein
MLMMNVAVLGASNKPDRYSYKAVMLLQEMGHSVYPVHPAIPLIEGIPAYSALRDIPAPVDVVTVYLSPANQEKVSDDLVRLRPQRVIFNPGAENPALAERLQAVGVEVLNACTLVMLRTGQF